MKGESFHTITKESTGQFKDRGSKFIGLVFPVKSEEDIKSKLFHVRKEYYDARHHCYAFILGNESEYYRSNDDGEPAHSAGDPILGQIRSLELTYCLVVVVRYFGGTKLGVPGLINAYRSAAREALENNTIIHRYITRPVEINFPYERMNEVMSAIKALDLEIISQRFELDCEMTVDVRPANIPLLIQRLNPFNEIRIDPAE